MNLEKLEVILKNEPAYRLVQAKKAVFCDLIDDWNEAKFLPAGLREKLKAGCSLEIKAELFEDKDGRTAKALIILDDSLKIESVLMRHADKTRKERGINAERRERRYDQEYGENTNEAEDDTEDMAEKGDIGRNTVCVSSQVGCPMACSFCATGKMGFTRNLDKWEIVEQVLFFARYLKNNKTRGSASQEEAKPQNSGDKVTNVVFMGMGEPFLNYDNVMGAIKTLNDRMVLIWE